VVSLSHSWAFRWISWICLPTWSTWALSQLYRERMAWFQVALRGACWLLVLDSCKLMIMRRLGNNLCGQSKRCVGMAIQISIANIAGIIASLIYNTQDSPRYLIGRTSSLFPLLTFNPYRVSQTVLPSRSSLLVFGPYLSQLSRIRGPTNNEKGYWERCESVESGWALRRLRVLVIDLLRSDIWFDEWMAY